MRHLEEYELFEALAQPNMEVIKKRLTNRLTDDISMDALNNNAYDAIRWLKAKYKVDLSPLIVTLRTFLIKSSCDQLPNILRGVKGAEYAKYVDTRVNAILKDFTAKQFATVAKGKKGVIKMGYLRSGQKGLIKDIMSKYNSNKFKIGQKALIEALIDWIYRLSVDISQGIRLNTNPGSNGGEYPDIAAYSDDIEKWADDYDKYHNDENKMLMAYLDSVTKVIWEA